MSLTAVAFLGCFTAGCFLAFSRHPIFGLITYVGTLYFEPAGHWWGHGVLHGVRWEMLPAVVTLAAMMVHRERVNLGPMLHSRLFRGVVVFLLWMAVQSLWAIDPATHQERIQIWSKFVIVMIMICGCIDSWKHLRWFLWSHVMGCFYLGWTAYSTYTGGRFEGFGIGSLAEANTGALQLVTGLIAAASLFLGGTWKDRIMLLVPIAFIADGIVTTVSRSGFLAAASSVVVFNFFAPRRIRLKVVFLSVLAGLFFVSLTTASYWQRMKTIEYEGAEVKGVDTGGGRLEIIDAQWKMFERHPLGCGSMCTTALSPQYLAVGFLSHGQRASHNTFMTMLVDHGIPGAVLYLGLLAWTFSNLRRAARLMRGADRFQAAVLPSIAAIMAAITIGDLFVQYPKLEVRVWFMSLLVVFVELAQRDEARVRLSGSAACAVVPGSIAGSVQARLPATQS